MLSFEMNCSKKSVFDKQFSLWQLRQLSYDVLHPVPGMHQERFQWACFIAVFLIREMIVGCGQYLSCERKLDDQSGSYDSGNHVKQKYNKKINKISDTFCPHKYLWG